MKIQRLLLALCLAAGAAFAGSSRVVAQSSDLGVPGFHHLHLLSTDPVAAVDFYTAHFASAKKTTWGGFPAVWAPTDVLILFTKVARPPLNSPQTAFFHFGWNVTDARGKLAEYLARFPNDLAPLYTGDGDKFVYISSDTWPGAGGTAGRTREEIEEARRDNVQPRRGSGFGYLKGPDGVWVEFAGNHPTERFNHVHMFHDDPRCATLWYRTHLNVPSWASYGSVPGETITAANCEVRNDHTPSWPALTREGMVRAARGGATFDDVSMNGTARQSPTPLVSTRGHTADHVGLSVKNLDAWLVKLKRERVRILLESYTLGPTRAVMIEGPSKEALELVEVP